MQRVDDGRAPGKDGRVWRSDGGVHARGCCGGVSASEKQHADNHRAQECTGSTRR